MAFSTLFLDSAGSSGTLGEIKDMVSDLSQTIGVDLFEEDIDNVVFQTNEFSSSQGEVTDTKQIPEDWMKKLLSSEDSGVKMPGNDPVIEMTMTMFTSLMALALQIDNKSEELQVYNVFNVAQTNLQEARPELYKKLEAAAGVNRPLNQGDDFSFPAMDKMIKENGWICPIKPVYGDNAYYSISKNEIVIPEKRQFKDGESFYTNLGHEMAHSTGSENHLGRLKPASFGSAEYAREELVAELSAALVAQRFGMTKHLKEDSASYLKSWLDSLKESPEFIKTTLTDVKKASHMINQHIDAMQLKIDQEQSQEAEQKQEKAPTMYYASGAYLQTTDATDRLDKFKNDGNYEALLTEAKEYDQGDAPDLSKINLSPTKYRGDDLLVEDEHYAVVYNPTVGGTYDVMRKVSAEEIKDNIIRYGLPEDATDDVKEVAKQMEKEEVVAQEEEQHYHRGR